MYVSGTTGDGCFSFDEFVEIASNMGKSSSNTAEEEEKELRDAFRVSEKTIIYFFFSFAESSY